MALISLILSVCGLLFCAYLYLELSKKLSSEDIGGKLSLASEELSKSYARQLREIETEWADMYSKFQRLAGRIDKNRGLEMSQNQVSQGPAPALIGTRSDLLRKRRGGIKIE